MYVWSERIDRFRRKILLLERNKVREKKIEKERCCVGKPVTLISFKRFLDNGFDRILNICM